MTLVAIVFVILLLINMPLAFTIGISGMMFFLSNPALPLSIPVQKMVGSTQSFPLLAVPFFVLAGNLMNATGITRRLIDFANVLTGHMRGGLAQVSVVLSALMGGISGSANADAAMESRILGPPMIKKGYSKGYAAAVIGLTSLITATIPPSIGLVLYGFVGEVSIGKLFVAGIVPGLLMTMALMVTTAITAKKKGYVAERAKIASFKEVCISLKNSIWALIFPLILIIGIRFGVFTASEAGAFAVVYAFIIGKFVYRELDWKKIVEVIKQTVLDNGIIMLIIICSGIFGYIIVYDRLPQTMAGFILGISTNPQILLLIILTFLLIIGMFMEATVNVLLLTPIFLPIVRSVGIDPVHFGILMVIINTMGGMTPPVGVTMYTTCSLLDCPTEQFAVESIPFVIAILILIAILAFIPQVVMFLPNLVFG
jgi:tripartite ATP-independent transporter DctM subunit